jgi:hypothetical protein
MLNLKIENNMKNRNIIRKKLISFLILLFFLITVRSVQAKQFILVSNGSSKCSIIIPEKATVIEIQAAKVFQDYVERISGARIPIKSDETKAGDGEILIGNVNRLKLKDIPLEKLGDDGLFIQSTGRRLIIAGGAGKGVLYSVYTFLEKYMGCRKYSSKVSYVPKQKTIILNSINDMEIPGFTYREEEYPDTRDSEYMDWNKLNSHTGSGTENKNKWGSFVHTFDRLLSAKEYGEAHPEYFSFYDGRRHPEVTARGGSVAQLCLTNPDVLEIVCKKLQSEIERDPDARYWSVSQNDNVNYCRDPNCAALDRKYAGFPPGSKMYTTQNSKIDYSPLGQGSLLTFVNKVAERFPDKIISTLAYQYSRVPPKNLIPRKNVNIMLCSIESPRNVPIEKGDSLFSSDLVGWSKLTHNIILWDYVVQFWNAVSPFPNLRTLQPNLQYFHDHGIQSVFEEGDPDSGGEFAELRAYMIAKLLWNPNLDFDKVMDDFLTGYYGNASKFIRQYIDLITDKMEQSGDELLIFGSPVDAKDSYLSDSLITVYNQLFDRAEKAVSTTPEILERVKTARLPIYYATLEIARVEISGKRGAFIASDHILKPNPKIVNMLHDFVNGCIKSDVSHVRERRTTPQQYLERYTKFLDENSRNPSTGKIASLN